MGQWVRAAVPSKYRNLTHIPTGSPDTPTTADSKLATGFSIGVFIAIKCLVGNGVTHANHAGCHLSYPVISATPDLGLCSASAGHHPQHQARYGGGSRDAWVTLYPESTRRIQVVRGHKSFRTRIQRQFAEWHPSLVRSGGAGWGATSFSTRSESLIKYGKLWHCQFASPLSAA